MKHKTGRYRLSTNINMSVKENNTGFYVIFRIAYGNRQINNELTLPGRRQRYFNILQKE